MISFGDLKKINILRNLSDQMLEKMQSMAQLHIFGDRSVVFREGQEAEYFFMLLKGKLLLEVEASETIMISLGAVKPGYSFGWSALFPESAYTSYAICVEPCEVVAVPGDKFLDLLEEDHNIGYRVMENVVEILKRRLDRRTGQFIETMKKHPDIQKLFSI